MICYAIKNNKGKYLGIGQDYKHYWTTIDFAFFFRELPRHNPKKEAEDHRDNRYPDCKVVKVEIKEIEDGKIDNVN